MQTRVTGFRGELDVADLPLDLIPERPYGLWVLEVMQHEHTDVLRDWREAGYRVRSSGYQLTGKDRKNSPGQAFDNHRVTFVLHSDETGDTATLVADVVLKGKNKTPSLGRLQWIQPQ